MLMAYSELAVISVLGRLDASLKLDSCAGQRVEDDLNKRQIQTGYQKDLLHQRTTNEQNIKWK